MTERMEEAGAARSKKDKRESFIGEFDPGSGRTLAACLTHASRTEIAGKFTGRQFEWRTGE